MTGTLPTTARLLGRLACFSIVLAGTAEAQNVVAPPDSSALRTITARGRLLAAYDQAAWHGTDAVLAKLKTPAGVEGFLAREDNSGRWHFLVGRLTGGGDTLLVVARAAQTAKPDSFEVSIPASPETGAVAEQRAFRALQTAGADLKAGPVPFTGQYNSYALPGPDGSWLVYFLPGQVRKGVYAHGGDFRYQVSADGKTIQSKFQMHRSVLISDVTGEAVAGFHTVVTADHPHESDVFLVLSRSPSKPEMIVTDHFDFQIHEDGSITWRYGDRKKQP